MPIQTLIIAPSSTLLRAGEYRARPYQVRQHEAVMREFQTVRSTLDVSATGTGKTVLFCKVAVDFGGALVIAHRDSLIRQAAEKLSAATGCHVEIEKAQERAGHAKYIVASVQTLRGERLKRFAADFPDIPLIIIDEAHRALAKSYRDVIAAWPNAKILGVTATADRSDGKGLKAVFETVADRYELLEATDDGWLAPLKWIPVHSTVDLSRVSTKKQDGELDFDQGELDDEINKHAAEIVRGVREALAKHGDESMRMLVFCPGVKTAHACAAADNEITPGCAAVVDGEMDDRLKKRVIERHKAGEFPRLYNVGVLTEGYDDACLLAIFDAAPSKSRLKVMQIWGRVTRTWPGLVDALNTPEERRSAIAASRKPFGLVFDLAGNFGHHEVIGPVDLLAGKDLSDGVRKRVKQIFADRGGALKDVLEQAEEEERKERARARAARRLADAAKVNIGKPRSIFERTGIEFEKRKNLPTRPEDVLAPGMRALMKHRGIPIPPGCNKQMFRRLIKEDKKREKSGTCRHGGVEWLRNFGIDAWKMPSVVARRIQREIILNGRKPLTVEQLAPLMERAPGEDDE